NDNILGVNAGRDIDDVTSWIVDGGLNGGISSRNGTGRGVGAKRKRQGNETDGENRCDFHDARGFVIEGPAVELQKRPTLEGFLKIHLINLRPERKRATDLFENFLEKSNNPRTLRPRAQKRSEGDSRWLQHAND